MKITIVEDQIEVSTALRKILNKKGYFEVEVFNGSENIEDILNTILSSDIFILDVKLGNISGIDILKKLREKNKTLPVILITAYTTPQNIIEATKYGVRDILEKPFSFGELIKIIKKYEKKEENKIEVELKDETFIGSYETMGKVYRLIGLSASNNMNVFIHGETGTGKELVAKMIYKYSNKSGEFIAVNCAAIPSELFESELFGHEKGAFTGAKERKIGLVEKANGGILFLDEIGEIPVSLQSKLLRFLETKAFYPVGSSKLKKADVKVVSASNIDISKYIEKGKFREDLYFRLSQIVIDIPPLRERKQDIPLLVNYFIKKANSELNTEIKGITEEAIEKLKDYNFPGNVRELKNMIYTACLNRYTGVLEKEDIKPLKRIECKISEEELIENLLDKYGLDKVSDISENLEKFLIKKVFEKTNYNITKTAQILKITRNTLKSKMKKYNLLK